ncbi:thioesterase family protein [Caballeronia insecticola]|uniref:Thioesterase/thiol ester dehydrase-isomerase n=1 Tax=Caballeronia insecticola TaxID=758793 RepID=R4X4Z9_9BURK|nr:thioesterase family protein [Caballeronia insecticola]BAN27737.1 thioesterase/thiol ester dehydrase-isomerase [Caballeronia insecticola]
MINDSLRVGAHYSRTIEVDVDRTISFLGDDLRIYATPKLIDDIERTCLDYLLDFVDDEENSVGTAVDIAHTGATLLGMTVRIEVSVASIEGRAVKFDVTVFDDIEQVCTGSHSRFVVNVDKLKARVREKANRVGALSA